MLHIAMRIKQTKAARAEPTYFAASSCLPEPVRGDSKEVGAGTVPVAMLPFDEPLDPPAGTLEKLPPTPPMSVLVAVVAAIGPVGLPEDVPVAAPLAEELLSLTELPSLTEPLPVAILLAVEDCPTDLPPAVVEVAGDEAELDEDDDDELLHSLRWSAGTRASASGQ
jgi:hypothetical protein